MTSVDEPRVYGSASTVRYTPTEWVHAGEPRVRGSTDWSKWPTLVEQFERETDANAGVSIHRVPVSLSTVAWYWRCEYGHRWRETAWSRIGRFYCFGNKPRIFQRVAGSKAACRACVLDRYAPVYEKCGHSSRSLELVSRRPGIIPGWCEVCEDPEPEIGDAVFVEHQLPTSQAEQTLRLRLSAVLPVTPYKEANAVVVAPTTWGARRVFPDILLHTYRIAVEYDSRGLSGDRHPVEGTDQDKDAALRAAAWEVVRVRTDDLPHLGPYDVSATGPTWATVESVRDAVQRILGSRDDPPDRPFTPHGEEQ